jgi:hypothetical protein
MAYSLLALGDSYTIGEGVAPQESFPYQAVRLLQDAGQSFQPPDILARTGWTTDELAAAMAGKDWPNGRVWSGAALRFCHPADRRQQSIPRTGCSRICGGIRIFAEGWHTPGSPRYRPLDPRLEHLPIRPYLSARCKRPDQRRCRSAIDAFNATAAGISQRYAITFIDITTRGRAEGSDPALYVADGLHPAAGTYRFWAEKLAGTILPMLAADR